MVAWARAMGVEMGTSIVDRFEKHYMTSRRKGLKESQTQWEP